MITPGREVQSVIVMSFGVRSITMRETLALAVEILTDLAIFENIVAEVIATEPIRIPTANNTKSVAYRIYFLSHILIFFSFSTHEQSNVV